MRSRFTAFYLKKPDYLLSTHRSGLPASLHAGSPSSSNTNSTDEREQLLSSMAQTSWLSVQVLHWAIDGTDKTKGEVEFVAFFFDTKRQQQNALPQQLHERSRFVQENKRWYYVDGEFLGTIKLGRNDVCWCGSAKKMKKCHG
jgi:SEC-C motif-containing protein